MNTIFFCGLIRELLIILVLVLFNGCPTMGITTGGAFPFSYFLIKNYIQVNNIQLYQRTADNWISNTDTTWIDRKKVDELNRFFIDVEFVGNAIKRTDANPTIKITTYKDLDTNNLFPISKQDDLPYVGYSMNAQSDKDFAKIALQFEGKMKLWNSLSLLNAAIIDTIGNIEIICDKNYKQSYPQGNSLKNICLYLYNPYSEMTKAINTNKRIQDNIGTNALYDIIQKNIGLSVPFTNDFYKGTVKNYDTPNNGVLSIKASDVGSKKLYLIGNIVHLLFIQKPDVAQTYSFTITIETKGGKKFSVTTPQVFVPN